MEMYYLHIWERDVVQVVKHLSVKVWIIRSILHSRCICSSGYFPF